MYLFPEWSMSMARIPPPPSPGSAENSNTYLPEERSHTFTTYGEKMTALFPTFCSCTKQKRGKKCDLASLITIKAFPLPVYRPNVGLQLWLHSQPPRRQSQSD